jgi:hypothetical protein
MDLIVNSPEESEYNDKNLKRDMVKILMDNLATTRTVYQCH